MFKLFKMRSSALGLFIACCLLCMPMIIDGSTTVSREPPAKRVLFGGWKPIRDVNEPHVKETGAFAVSEYNKRHSSSEEKLLFRRVVAGEQQVVAGINYRLVVEVDQQQQQQPHPISLRGLVVNDDIERGEKKSIRSYEAVVYEKPWEGYRNLTSFKPKN